MNVDKYNVKIVLLAMVEAVVMNVPQDIHVVKQVVDVNVNLLEGIDHQKLILCQHLKFHYVLKYYIQNI
jgi:hypothetical protein